MRTQKAIRRKEEKRGGGGGGEVKGTDRRGTRRPSEEKMVRKVK